jgi:predicted nucleotidyltransferase
MHALVENHRADLAELCRRHHVKRLELFGSATGERFDPASSDLDFLVDFQPLECVEHARAYFALKHAVEDLFQRPVDLVELDAIRNPYFLQFIEPTRILLYAA